MTCNFFHQDFSQLGMGHSPVLLRNNMLPAHRDLAILVHPWHHRVFFCSKRWRFGHVSWLNHELTRKRCRNETWKHGRISTFFGTNFKNQVNSRFPLGCRRVNLRLNFWRQHEKSCIQDLYCGPPARTWNFQIALNMWKRCEATGNALLHCDSKHTLRQSNMAGTFPFVDESPTTMYRRFPSLPCLITSVANSATCSSISALRTGTLFCLFDLYAKVLLALFQLSLVNMSKPGYFDEHLKTTRLNLA